MSEDGIRQPPIISGAGVAGGGRISDALYDVVADPGETLDLAAAQPEIRARLETRLEDYATSHGVILPDTSPVCGG